MGRWWCVLWLGLSMSLGGCPSRVPPTEIRTCPLLVVRGSGGPITYGGVASVGGFRAGSCIEVFHGEERVARTFVGPSGSFAVQFVIEGEANGAFSLRASDEEGGTDERVALTFERVTQAEISYPANTTPLIARADGTLEFNGSLEPGLGARIESAWMVNWSNGLVASVRPTPPFSSAFTATVPGERGNCAAILSRHDEGVGGCWWPQGGGGCAPLCTEEDYRSGECETGIDGPPCVGRRGCEVLEVEERISDTPPPETARVIPVLPPPPDPPDAGRPDAPLPDEGVM